MKSRILIACVVMALSLQAQAGTELNGKQEVKPDNWNRSVKLQPMTAKQAANVGKFSKNNQLRCWQNGDLIVLENDWKPVDSKQGRLLSNGSKKLHTYDYGETFCIYLGG